MRLNHENDSPWVSLLSFYQPKKMNHIAFLSQGGKTRSAVLNAHKAKIFVVRVL